MEERGEMEREGENLKGRELQGREGLASNRLTLKALIDTEYIVGVTFPHASYNAASLGRVQCPPSMVRRFPSPWGIL